MRILRTTLSWHRLGVLALLLSLFLCFGSCGGGGGGGYVPPASTTGFWIYNEPIDWDGFAHISHILTVDDGVGPLIPVDIPPGTQSFINFYPGTYDIHVVYDDAGAERDKFPFGWLSLYNGQQITITFVY